MVDALAAGPDDLPSVRAALVGLDVERQRLEGELDAAKRRTAGGEAVLESVLDELLTSLGNVREVLGAGGSEERKTSGAELPQGDPNREDETTDRPGVVPHPPEFICHVGGGGRNRTSNTGLMRPLLCH